jgi:hypothetical protein
MPRPLSIATAPAALRGRLNDKLRANGYSALAGLSKWMGDQGYSISKSSLHRYALRLRKVDAVDRIGMAALLETPAAPASKRRRLNASKISSDKAATDILTDGEKWLLDSYKTLVPVDQKMVDSYVKRLLPL